MERKMATIRKIDDIQHIEGADLIHAIKIGGWTVVAQKSMGYKVNDLVTYCEIDSFIPTEVAPFLTPEGKEPREYSGVRGERLKTKKLKGVISQGLLLPLSVLEHVESEIIEGLDVSVPLGIIKWEPPAEFQAANAKGLFPHFIPKTDQERVQNIHFDSWKYEQNTFEITEKLDGSSMTVFIKDGIIGVCSRNLELKESEPSTFWDVAKSSGVVEALFTKAGCMEIALQGELIGPGIQGNKYNLTEHKFYIFDVFNIAKQEYMLPMERRVFVEELGLLHTPVLDSIAMISDVQTILSQAEGKSALNIKTEREGLVYKSNQSHESFKAISNKWLLKNE